MSIWRTTSQIKLHKIFYKIQFRNQNTMNQPSPNDQSILKFLKHLDLSREESTLFLTLLKHGTLTKLETSRLSGISRTQIYRLVESLTAKGLVEEITDDYKKLIQAAGPEKLRFIVEAKQKQAVSLQETYSTIKDLLTSFQATKQPGTKVMFYRGVDGIKQMIYNVLRTKGELVGFSFKDIRSITGNTFADHFYQECVDAKLKIRDIYSDEYLKSIKPEEFTTVRYPALTKLWQSRYLSPDKLSVQIQMDIYNDVTTFYHWHDDDIFGVEIYNEKVAKFHRQMFELLWLQAIPESEIKVNQHL